MGGNGGKRKKNSKKKAKRAAGAVAAAAPRRSTLSPDQRLRVENMHEILGEVWEPFKTAAGAIRGLETDPAPWLELEFWDSLAEAFLRYFGKTITLQVDTAGLRRAKTRAQTAAREVDSGNADGQDQNEDLKAVASLPKAPGDDDVGIDLEQERQQHESDGEKLQEQSREARETADFDSEPCTKQVEMLPMEAVGHLLRADRLGIIRKTVPKERRMAVLQRLFQLAQAPSEEVERLVAAVKELKNNSSPAEIRDVNLLETWQGVREERAVAWEKATEKVRLAAHNAASATPAATENRNDITVCEGNSPPTDG